MIDYETAKLNLGSLIQWAQQNNSDLSRNEANTRLHLIDQLIKDCLGWPLNTIEVERYHTGEYSDYELGMPAKRLVIEAKREGKYFELPPAFNKFTCSIKTLFEISGDIKSAVEQAMRYCQTRGIPIGAITNGHQLIAFIGSRQDSIPPESGRAIVFDSLKEMENRFQELWNCLSFSGIESGYVFTILSENRLSPPPEKLSARIIGYPGYKNRNPVAAELQILGGLFLEDITKIPETEEEFIRLTYCESGALSQYAMVSREILASRYTKFFEKEVKVATKPVRTKKGIQPELRDDLIAASISKRPIILVGDVGVGKTTFIRHLIFVDAKDVLEQAIVLYLDFGSKPALSREIADYVIIEFKNQLEEKYGIDIHERNFVKGVYHYEVVKFSKGIYGDLKESKPELFREKEIEHLAKLLEDSEQHLKRCIHHIVNGQKRQVVILLDNVDQRPIDFQEQVFLIAQSFAQDWPVTTFVALRPDTFAHSRASGSLAAYQPRAFTIDPPRVDRVIRKRLDYALAKLHETGRLPSFPSGVRLTSAKLEQYIGVMRHAFDKSEEIISFVDNMSNGNLRKALDFIVAFVGSGHVDSDKIFKKIEESGRYYLPLHEFLRAVIFNDNEFFDPSTSPVINVYDISSNNGHEHFIMLMLISFVERIGMSGGNEGFVKIDDIYKSFQGLSFTERQIQSTIHRTINKGLTAPPQVQQDKNIDRLRILPAGAYTLKKLSNMFSYVDAIIVDTPITDGEYRTRIQPVNSIEDRIERGLAFIEYLDKCWEPKLGGIFEWPIHSQKIKNEMYSIKKRLDY